MRARWALPLLAAWFASVGYFWVEVVIPHKQARLCGAPAITLK